MASACGSSSDLRDDTQPSDPSMHADSTHAGVGHGTTTAGVFAPPPPAAGYTRIVAPVMTGLAPGSETVHCQFVQAPLDRDMDVLDVQGFQSAGGHHTVAYGNRMDVPLGTSRLCTADDNLAEGFLGGTGGEGGGSVQLPPGVAFRLPKGSAIMLNTHFLNTSDQTIDGQSVVDFQFVESDGKRIIASLFSNGNRIFQVPGKSAAEALAECKLPRDMQFILFTNHMHDYGTQAKTEVVRADGRVELVHEDPKWTYEMQFRAVYSKWSLEQPLTIAKGETVRTRCNWQNATDSMVEFPREMCFGVGFFLSDGSSSPVCLDGQWIER
jgi:hypothetical protein